MATSSAEDKLRKKKCWCGGSLTDSCHPEYGICAWCGTLVFRTEMNEQELSRFYTLDKYWRDHVPNVSKYPGVEERSQADFRGRIQRWYGILSGHKQTIKDLLEIGCAHGGFLSYCRTQGIENVVGNEVDVGTCDFARSRFGLPHVVPGIFPNVTLPFEKFDAVVGFDVLEHFTDPTGALERVEDLLRADAICIFQTPRYRGEDRRWAQFRPREHLFLFSQESVQKILARCGLSTITILDGINPDDMFVIAGKTATVPQPGAFEAAHVTSRADNGAPLDTARIGSGHVPAKTPAESQKPARAAAESYKEAGTPKSHELPSTNNRIMEHKMKKVSVIIPYHQPLHDLETCLKALNKTLIYPIYEVILVNDSPPEEHHPKHLLRTHTSALRFPVRVIEHKERLGFASTCNEGAEAAKGDLLVFLNADTVPMGGWLEALVAFLERNPTAGVLGSKLLFPADFTIQHIGGAFDSGKKAFHPYEHTPGDLPFARRSRCLQWVTGACFMVSKNDFEALGGFDPQYGSTFEDNDFCFKMRFQLGKQVWLVADSLLLHRAGGSGLKDYEAYRDRNFRIFAHKWADRIQGDEFEIYRNDGFAPEFLDLLSPLGLSRQFSLISLLLRLFHLEGISEQVRYVGEKGYDGFIRDVGRTLSDEFPLFLMSYPSLFLQVIQREDSIRDVTAALSRMSSTELFSVLQSAVLKDRQKSDLQGLLAKKLDAESFFLGMYNLASLLLKEGQVQTPKEMFRAIAAMTGNVNCEIAGKSYYKLAQVSDDPIERVHFLKTCLSLYPVHGAARRELEVLVPAGIAE